MEEIKAQPPGINIFKWMKEVEAGLMKRERRSGKSMMWMPGHEPEGASGERSTKGFRRLGVSMDFLLPLSQTICVGMCLTITQ